MGLLNVQETNVLMKFTNRLYLMILEFEKHYAITKDLFKKYWAVFKAESE